MDILSSFWSHQTHDSPGIDACLFIYILFFAFLEAYPQSYPIRIPSSSFGLRVSRPRPMYSRCIAIICWHRHNSWITLAAVDIAQETCSVLWCCQMVPHRPRSKNFQFWNQYQTFPFFFFSSWKSSWYLILTPFEMQSHLQETGFYTCASEHYIKYYPTFIRLLL